jgi:hypothetical protein
MCEYGFGDQCQPEPILLLNQGTLRRRPGRAVPGRPAQGRAETLIGQRRARHPAGHRAGRGEPARLPAAGPTLHAASRQLDGILPEDRTCHLDRGYDSTVTRQLLDQLGFDGLGRR